MNSHDVEQLQIMEDFEMTAVVDTVAESKSDSKVRGISVPTLSMPKLSFGKPKGKKSDPDAPKALKNYKYTGINAEGEPVSGKLKAAAHSDVDFKLRNEGIKDLHIQVAQAWYELEFGKTVPPDVLLQFTRQLASFSSAGIPAARGLSILAETTEHKKMKEILESLVVEIEGGATLSESIGRHTHVFPDYYSTILSAAERSGDLPGALRTLNSYIERDLRSRRAVRSAMSYPIVLVLLAGVAVTVLSVIVLPRFESFFKTLGAQLPLTTRILLSLTRFVGSYWWIMAILSVSFVVALVLMSRNPKGRVILDGLLLKTPIFGKIFSLIALERFCRVLSTLVRTDVPLPDALDLAGRATGNKVFENVIETARVQVLNGEGLASPLGESRLFPSAAIQIFRVGEESGELEAQLEQAASYYGDELDHKMKNFTALIEPITLIVLGGGVGFVAVALISAMYGIYSGIK